MMRLSQAAQALGCQYIGANVEFSGVSTDSRSTKNGDLFVALKGERYDGHSFIAQAASAGAAAALVEKTGFKIQDSGLEQTLPLLVADDSIRALGSLAAYWRRQFAIPLVALTGSNGKTTVKEMLAAILREVVVSESSSADPEYGVLATRGNLNNQIGVPLTLLELRSGHRYAVIEMGMNHVKEIEYISQLAGPDVALINNAGSAHIQNFESTEGVARAKAEIFAGLKPGGIAVINADDRYAPLWRELAGDRPRVEFGLHAPASVTATYRLRHIDSEIILKTPLGTACGVVSAPGVHNVMNALAASAAATALEIPLRNLMNGLSRFRGVKSRLQRTAGLHGATLIDDTYNANPESVRAAISVLATSPGRKMLVLGDMGELGPDGAALHAHIGELCRNAGIEWMLTLGDLSQHAARAFGPSARHFIRIEDLLAEIENLLAPDVTVLVKGSRFMQMERIVKSFAGLDRSKQSSRGQA